uniref:Uncharacterized protein n=1 Tax=Oryza barthii TaxID=65489 RepID=A0A0D3EP10_9ORYZ
MGKVVATDPEAGNSAAGRPCVVALLRPPDRDGGRARPPLHRPLPLPLPRGPRRRRRPEPRLLCAKADRASSGFSDVVWRAAAADAAMGKVVATDPEAGNSAGWADRASSRFSARPTAMVAVLALLSTGLSLSLSRADLAAVVVTEPRLLCAKADRASSCFSARPTAMVVVLALLSTGLSLSLSRADLAAVVVAEPRLLCAKANTIAASARLGHPVRRCRRAHRRRCRLSPLSPEPSTAAVAEPPRSRSSTPSRRPAATTSGGEGRGGVGHGCCKRCCRWLQMALIPSLPRSLNQTKNWDRPILQTKHPNGIIPILKSGMVSSHPT